MIQLKKINDIKVTPMKIPKIDPKKIKGYDMINELYANVYMVAHKKSGKTTCIFNILKECTNKDTKLVFFGSTIYNDPGYRYIFKYFKKRGNPILKYTSIIEDKVDRLTELLNTMKIQDDDDEEPKEKIKYISVDDDDDDDNERKRKPKKIAPEIVFIFDDLGKAMRIESFSTLIKTNRHYLCKTLISSQNVKDIQPDARENIDELILFKGIKKKLLETIYEDFNLKLPLETFLDIYYKATEGKYSFLTINTKEHEYRQNFDSQFMI